MKVPKMLGQFEYKATSSTTFSCQDIDDESSSRTRGHWLQQWMLSATIAQTNATKPENIYMIEMPALFGKHYRVAITPDLWNIIFFSADNGKEEDEEEDDDEDEEEEEKNF